MTRKQAEEFAREIVQQVADLDDWDEMDKLLEVRAEELEGIILRVAAQWDLIRPLQETTTPG